MRPRFSRYYITFPLSALHAGKAILSATPTLSQSGNACALGEKVVKSDCPGSRFYFKISTNEKTKSTLQ
jgi:hypothetical protein